MSRLSFETLALGGCGLFVAELIRNRRLTLAGQARLEALVETSPAAIVTVDERGLIELANQAAAELLSPRDNNLIGMPIAAFLPELHHALRWEEAPQFRASMQCQGHRGNGESFTADVWFSTYKEGPTPKVAAIVAEVTEELTAVAQLSASANGERTALNDREMEILRLLVQGLANKEIAARMEISESTVKNALQQLFAKPVFALVLNWSVLPLSNTGTHYEPNQQIIKRLSGGSLMCGVEHNAHQLTTGSHAGLVEQMLQGSLDCRFGRTDLACDLPVC